MTMGPAEVSTGSFARMFFLCDGRALGLGRKSLLLAVFAVAVARRLVSVQSRAGSPTMPKWSRPALAAFVSLTLSLFFVSTSAHAQAPACAVDTIPRAELAAAMRAAALSNGEYDLLATPNWPRFQSALYLQLIRNAMGREPTGGLLFIPPKDLFWEFVSLSELADPGEAPAHLLWALHLDQGTQLEYRPDGIVESVKKGTHPTLAINVRTAWPDRPDGTDKFSVLDTLSVPKLRVTNRQEISYRMLDFGDMVMNDEIRGTSGRPLSGVLGALFSLIGEGSLVYYRSVLADEGLQVVRVKAKKMIFSKTATITVYPDVRTWPLRFPQTGINACGLPSLRSGA